MVNVSLFYTRQVEILSWLPQTTITHSNAQRCCLLYHNIAAAANVWQVGMNLVEIVCGATICIDALTTANGDSLCEVDVGWYLALSA